MFELIMIGDCACYLTSKTAQRVRAELAAYGAEAESEDLLRSAIADWEMTHSADAWDFLSDIYKDVYGFRPSVGMFN